MNNWLKNFGCVLFRYIIPLISVIISVYALRQANDAVITAKDANKISNKSNVISNDANILAKKSLNISLEANNISTESNAIARDANRITKSAVQDSLIKAEDSNRIAKNSNEIAQKSKANSDKALTFSTQYGEINAQLMWNTLRDAYDWADEDVLEWEKVNNIKRIGSSVETLEELKDKLNKLKFSNEAKSLYIKRFDKRMSLVNASEVYKPYKERLANIDFSVPVAPKLPIYLTDEKGMNFTTEDGKRIILE